MSDFVDPEFAKLGIRAAEAERTSRRKKIIKALPRDVLQRAVDTYKHSGYHERKFLEDNALANWDDIEDEAFRYLEGAKA